MLIVNIKTQLQFHSHLRVLLFFCGTARKSGENLFRVAVDIFPAGSLSPGVSGISLPTGFVEPFSIISSL
jgi:hypothetical protein